MRGWPDPVRRGAGSARPRLPGDSRLYCNAAAANGHENGPRPSFAQHSETFARWRAWRVGTLFTERMAGTARRGGRGTTPENAGRAVVGGRGGCLTEGACYIWKSMGCDCRPSAGQIEGRVSSALGAERSERPRRSDGPKYRECFYWRVKQFWSADTNAGAAACTASGPAADRAGQGWQGDGQR